ncbi:electron transport complex protein RnfC [Mariprofundus micogutta]|uniref:Ion-translocating oxidoreductase complex subunit C n=1 Tax=Mariprofundus micogutta TaxID=1921010 RepID=A0A1L8CPV3_9PROT|nr:electron transport complex subunit RsxC [Mariprofundus micogutta]GAV20966.1 electron transport complex protein RnfC [Mariprofundus micogutta]
MPAIVRKLAQRLGMLQHSFVGGVHPNMHKLSADCGIEDCDLSPVHVLPMKQHIGEICSPLVAVGDQVLRGQKIAKSEGYLSVPVHAPTSGRVVKIEEHAIAHPSGMGLPSIFIESDGDDTIDESLSPISDWANSDPTQLRERARMCGLAGLGGAVFPTFIKLVQDKRFPIETVVLNGIECEPFLTNDHRLMLEHAEEILEGMAILMHMVGAASGIIAIENNKQDAAEAMQLALDARSDMDDVAVMVLPTRYPQGSEKQLIYTLTGREVPAGKLPMHIGVLCQNVGTTKALFDAVVHGRALTERIVTVSGDALPNPANLRVRLGTSVRTLFARQGLEDFSGTHIVHGGPMMGERLKHPDFPVVKSSTGLLAMSSQFMGSAHTVEQPCIRCGHCSEACPISLVPNLLADQCRSDQFDKAASYDLFDCIECGACSYVCPSNIPLVHYFRYGKGQLALQRREQAFADASRQRSEARDARIEREKAEKAARRTRVRQTHAPKTDQAKADTDKPAAVDSGAAAVSKESKD